MVEVWLRGGLLEVVNYYNPCQILDLEVLERVEGQDRSKVLWCSDFNNGWRKWPSDGKSGLM